MPLNTSPILSKLESSFEEFQPRLVVVFGSVAKGQARSDSDLDIAVWCKGPIGVEERLAMISRLASLTGRAVDLVDLHTVGEPLLGEIIKTGRVIVGSRTDWVQLQAQHLANLEDFVPLQQHVLKQRRQAWLKQ